jgi:hypothetical protein
MVRAAIPLRGTTVAHDVVRKGAPCRVVIATATNGASVVRKAILSRSTTADLGAKPERIARDLRRRATD